MHVVLDARTSTSRFPGIGRYVDGLIEGLSHCPPAQLDLTLFATSAHRHEIEAEIVPIDSGPVSIAQQWHIPVILRKLDPDVYHSPFYGMPYRTGIPTVLTVHDLIPIVCPDQVSPRARLFFPPLIRLAIRAADRLIAISEATRDDLIHRLHVPADIVSVVSPASRFRGVTPDPLDIERFRARAGLKQPYVLYLGSDKPHKNLIRLLEAWAILSRDDALCDRMLVLAGAWDLETNGLGSLARELRIEHRVRMLGRVSDSDLVSLYGGADVFVFPSLYEGFGLPVVEAMSLGVPVACSDAASLPEVCGEGARYFNPKDSRSIAEAIGDLMSSVSLRARLSASGLRQAGHFSWRRCAEETFEVYKTLHQTSAPLSR